MTLAPWHQMAPASLSRKSIQIHPNPKVAGLNKWCSEAFNLPTSKDSLLALNYVLPSTISWSGTHSAIKGQGGERKWIDSARWQVLIHDLSWLSWRTAARVSCKSIPQAQILWRSRSLYTDIHCTSTRQHAGMQKIWISCPAISCERIGSALGLMVAIHQ